MSDTHPCHFTIVLPTHNGGAYLRGCVASVLAQTWPFFELAVLENASDDGSRQWLEGLADPRVRLHPSDRLLPIQDNWARALALPKHEFMTLLGDDDALDPDYLETVAALIDRHPDATLYQTQFRLIDAEGQRLRAASPVPERETAAEYLAARLQQRRDSFGTGYVMRAADYEAAGGIPAFERLLFADDALWLTLMRRGGKAAAPRECFSYRSHPASTSASADWRSHITAMSQYVSFLQDVSRQDAPVRDVFGQYGPRFFLDYCRHMYLLALVGATQRGRHLEANALPSIRAALSQVAPTLADRIPRRRDLRLREFINRWAAVRLAYNLFIYARHGDWNGRKVRTP